VDYEDHALAFTELAFTEAERRQPGAREDAWLLSHV
jgi:hypothetical protein